MNTKLASFAVSVASLPSIAAMVVGTRGCTDFNVVTDSEGRMWIDLVDRYGRVISRREPPYLFRRLAHSVASKAFMRELS